LPKPLFGKFPNKELISSLGEEELPKDLGTKFNPRNKGFGYFLRTLIGNLGLELRKFLPWPRREDCKIIR